MFALSDDDCTGTILGCGDGPASFNAEATQRGHRVVSCDPLYRFDAQTIQSRVEATYVRIMDETQRNADDFVWNAIPSPEALGALRLQAMQEFLKDYESGRTHGRYVDAELPTLPFGPASFDLVVCSHLLFLYSTQLTHDFHLAALDELCRVAGEVRVFPLVALSGMPSPYIEPVRIHLAAQGLEVSIEKVAYEFRRGADQMMRIRHRSIRRAAPLGEGNIAARRMSYAPDRAHDASGVSGVMSSPRQRCGLDLGDHHRQSRHGLSCVWQRGIWKSRRDSEKNVVEA
jgi:SAM-dependent methyltransferase